MKVNEIFYVAVVPFSAICVDANIHTFTHIHACIHTCIYAYMQSHAIPALNF